MKKNTAPHRTKKPRKVKGPSYQRGGPIDQLSRKKPLDFDVKAMVKRSSQFIARVDRLLEIYHHRITTEGVAVLGPDSGEIVQIIDQIRIDLNDYEEELNPIKSDVDDYLALTEGDEYSWLAASIDLTARMDTLLNRHAELYLLNHQTLMTFDH